MFKGFQKPKRLVANTETLTDRYGMFTAQPFERGFGTTIGNSLRRVLLSSIEGAAITAVRIEGVEHEFSPIPGVVEDATDIILNLKQVPFKIMGEGIKTVRLQRRPAGRSAQRPDRNRRRRRSAGPQHAHRHRQRRRQAQHRNAPQDGPRLRQRRQATSTRTWRSATFRSTRCTRRCARCNFAVEAARLGQMTDYDKLTLEVWTNGAISPQDAIGQAAKLLKDHMTIFINFEEAAGADRRSRPSARMDKMNESPEPLRRRAGAERPLLQLPEERQHSDHRRTGAEDRSRNAAHQEFRPQVAQRDQGDSGATWACRFGMKIDAHGRLVAPPPPVARRSDLTMTPERRRPGPSSSPE